jgi:uncharacterized protein YmfQ (DUF2313 family)
MGTDLDYLGTFQRLQPPGKAWARDQGALLTSLFYGMAGVFARIDARAGVLLQNADPRTAEELFPEWLEFAGLPDPCIGLPPTIAEQRAAIQAKLTDLGGQSIARFISLGAELGYAITITEFDAYICELPCELPVDGEEWRFVWRVNGPQVTIFDDTCEDSCETPLRWWGNQVLECEVKKYCPAHTQVLFAYPDPIMDEGGGNIEDETGGAIDAE